MVLSDEKRALLGDHEAQVRITKRGELLPCCGEVPELKFIEGIKAWVVECSVNGHIHNTGFCDSEYAARLVWNTRAPILSAEEVEMLDEH